jgi:hypothetical protein
MSTTDKLSTPTEIASAALALWDANAEEAESPLALGVAVASGLIELGASKNTAALAAALVGKAFEFAASPEPVPPELEQEPLFVAMLEQLRSGEWDTDAMQGE